ncbi:extracellular solute-binding protein, family 1 [Gottschalkia purinilytica]|uniref:Extracellular solute-binding protein, family 1 n=1 Tax=Gottschalkia purinilytica TaxID=1503 RepID=A0A0L0WCE2_GOTPU|nr:sugar ABC transporter substrate-binding protein [Gottschalkia purinilytica]KNF09149.1 extracellular solute-binding protein, family 1 [Gottschalkia purinilytica]
MKKKIKKIISIILIIFIICWPIYALFFSIDNGVEDTKIEDEDSNWRGVIKLWDFPRLDVTTGSRYGWMQEKIKKFEAENPGVYIELQPIDWDKGPIKLEVALETGNVPDIAPIGTDYIYMNDKVLEPLDQYFDESDKKEFKYQALKSVMYNDKMWGVPFMMTTYGMYINLDLFKEKQVEPPVDGNWTYEEFVKKMKKLTYDSDNDGKIDQYGFHSFVKPNYYNIWGLILSDGAEIIKEDNDEYIFNGEKAVSGLNKVVDLKNKYKVTPEDFGVSNENKAWDMFCKDKKVASYIAGSWAVKVLDELNRSGEGFEYDIVNYPIGDKKLPVSLNNSVSAFGVFKQKDKEKLNMIIKFLKFLIEDETQKDLEKMGVFTVKSTIEDMYANNEKMKKMEDILSYTQTVPKHAKWKEVDRILQNQIRLSIIGEKSAEEALKEANKQITQLMNN